MPSQPLAADMRAVVAKPSTAMRRVAVVIPLIFVAGHVLSIALGGDRAKQFSLVFLILGPLVAAGACLLGAREDRAKGGWLAMAGAMLLWSGGMAVNLVSELLPDARGASELTMFLFVLYGVPVIFALASPDREPWYVRAVDGALALVLGYLFFVCTMTFTEMSSASQTGFLNLRLMFDIENLFIALFALTRFVASRKRPRRAFFRMVAIYAALYLATAFYVNHFQSESDYGGLIDVLINLPFLVLAALALRYRPAAPLGPLQPRLFERVVRTGSPLMLSATLLVISAALVRGYPMLAVGGFVAATLGYGVRNVLVQVRSLEERDAFERMSMLDALTGVPNRRQFEARLRTEWERARRSGASLVVLMIDIDHFKLLNDNFGHPEGGQRLREVARALASCATRGSDMVARYGGEEFAAILPYTNPSNATALAESMRFAVEQLDLVSPAPGGRVTVSIGAGCVDSAQGPGVDGLLALADGALYEAKQGGRNRVVVRNAVES